MQIVLAHSSSNFSKQLKQALVKIGFDNVYVANNGFEALNYIIRNYTKVIIIQENLPSLNAKDIINALFFKGIKAKFIILQTKGKVPNTISKTVSTTYININKKGAIEKLLILIKKELSLQKTVN